MRAMTPQEQSILRMLQFARAYLAKMVADGWQPECVMSPETALRKIDRFIETMEMTR